MSVSLIGILQAGGAVQGHGTHPGMLPGWSWRHCMAPAFPSPGRLQQDKLKAPSMSGRKRRQNWRPCSILTAPSTQPCKFWHQLCWSTGWLHARAALQGAGGMGCDTDDWHKFLCSVQAAASVSPPGEQPARGGFLRQGPPPIPPAHRLPHSLSVEMRRRGRSSAAPTLPLHLFGALRYGTESLS